MSYLSNKILNLAKQLYPKGRAFKMPPALVEESIYVTEDGTQDYVIEDGSDDYVTSDPQVSGGIFERFTLSFGGDGSNQLGTLERYQNDQSSLLDSLLPDNPNFTDGTVSPLDNDCNDWERRLGLIQYGVTSSLTPTTEQRKQTIAVKMAYPGTDMPRQSAGYLQMQLRSVGFDVYVYENLSNLAPAAVIPGTAGRAVYGFFQFGQYQFGQYTGSNVTIIANYIDESKDGGFVLSPPNYHGLFYIGGPTLGSFANVPLVQKAQFRQQILQLKPLQLAGFLLINYT